MKIMSSILLMVLLLGIHSSVDAFQCEPYQSNIEIDDLPFLSRVFQTNVQLVSNVNLFNAFFISSGIDVFFTTYKKSTNLPVKKKNTDIRMLYDHYNFKAELIADENVNEKESLNKQTYLYATNELLNINGKCLITKLNETDPNEVFFGLKKYIEAGYHLQNMDLPEDVLHFRQPNFTFFKAEPTTFRGIPVDHYKSCQNWPLLKSVYHIDYFFTRPGYRQGVSFSDVPVPIAAIIQGTVQERPIRNEYNYFQFRPAVEHNKVFSKPEGLFCEGQFVKEAIPNLPLQFSFRSEVIIKNLNSFVKDLAQSFHISYEYESQGVLYEFVDPADYKAKKIVHDYFSGVSYTFDKDADTCELNPIGGDYFSDPNVLATGLGIDIRMKTPNEFFHLDDSFFYLGTRYERGRECDVYNKNSTDYVFPGLEVQPKFWIIELYFLSMENTDQGVDSIEAVVPVAVKIWSPLTNTSIINNIFDFDSTIKLVNEFDITPCYEPNAKKEFAIQFQYPIVTYENTTFTLTAEEFLYFYELKVRQNFYRLMLVTLTSDYNFSPYRFIPPRIRAFDDHFVIFTGLTDRAPDLKQFTKTNQSRADVNNAKYTLASNSAAECATQCLDSSSIGSEFLCLSFDFCNDQKKCAFYNNSHVTDPNINLESAPLCDHYSKTVDTADATDKETIYRQISDMLVRGELNLDILSQDDQVTSQIKFIASDIYPATYEAEPERFETGTSSFFQEFLINQFDVDYNTTEINENKEMFIRQRSGVSLDECSSLCYNEPSFRCLSMTFNNYKRDCKWSSLAGVLNEDVSNNTYLVKSAGYDWFTRDLLFNYKVYKDQTTSLMNVQYVPVNSVYECASKCDSSTTPCRSFNFCKKSGSYVCATSENHFNSTDKSPANVYSPICDHYSKRTILDYQLVPSTQLERTPQTTYFNLTVENCAQLCEQTEDYICRSFDYFNSKSACYLYQENLQDIDKMGKVTGKTNEDCNHYSRLYFTENGKQVSIVGKIQFYEQEYGAGTQTLVSILFSIVGLAAGIASVFLFRKYKNRNKCDLPSMEFINPNYIQ